MGGGGITSMFLRRRGRNQREKGWPVQAGILEEGKGQFYKKRKPFRWNQKREKNTTKGGGGKGPGGRENPHGRSPGISSKRGVLFNEMEEKKGGHRIGGVTKICYMERANCLPCGVRVCSVLNGRREEQSITSYFRREERE